MYMEKTNKRKFSIKTLNDVKITISAYPVLSDSQPQHTFALFKKADSWIVIEPESGIQIATGNTILNAMDKAEIKLEKYIPKNFDKLLAKRKKLRYGNIIKKI